MNEQVRQLDRAAMTAVSGSGLAPQRGATLRSFADTAHGSAAEVLESIEPLRIAAKSEAENIGHAVSSYIFFNLKYLLSDLYSFILLFIYVCT